MKRKILGKEFEVEEVEKNIWELQFYPENPRVYSLLYNREEPPSQEEIEKLMFRRDHVKQLKESIKINGLLEPLIVKGNVVLEGNSRLAAHRMLDREGSSLDWRMVTCMVLPDEVDDTHIFALLGQYHIVGRTDWDPYEKASYLYRRQQQTKIPTSTMARELGITKSEVEKMINVIELMIQHDDNDKRHYSHYDEYLKSPAVRKYRETSPVLDETIANSIKNGEIQEASHIRKLSEIAKLKGQQGKKLMHKIADGKMTIYEAHEAAESSGGIEDVVKRLQKFRSMVSDKEFEKQIFSSEAVLKHAKFEINRICRALNPINKKLN